MTREKAYEILNKAPVCYGCDGSNDTFPYNCEECEGAFLKAFKALKQPEIVYCKDCKYAIPSSENFIMCTAPYESQYPKAYKPIDWFCKGGERKEGDRE